MIHVTTWDTNEYYFTRRRFRHVSDRSFHRASRQKRLHLLVHAPVAALQPAARHEPERPARVSRIYSVSKERGNDRHGWTRTPGKGRTPHRGKLNCSRSMGGTESCASSASPASLERDARRATGGLSALGGGTWLSISRASIGGRRRGVNSVVAAPRAPGFSAHIKWFAWGGTGGLLNGKSN